MNKPTRCTTHFHACDCREYEFEQIRKEVQEKDRIILSQEKERQRTEAFWKEKLCEIQDEKDTEIERLKSDLKYLLKGTKYFRPDMQKYCEGIIARHNLSETPNSSKEGV